MADTGMSWLKFFTSPSRQVSTAFGIRGFIRAEWGIIEDRIGGDEMSDQNPFRGDIEQILLKYPRSGAGRNVGTGLEVIAFWQLRFETPGLNGGDEACLRG